MELDYALGWALRGIAGLPYLAGVWSSMGGTCLRKCYFPDYRFSEDLDFTATLWFGEGPCLGRIPARPSPRYH